MSATTDNDGIRPVPVGMEITIAKVGLCRWRASARCNGLNGVAFGRNLLGLSGLAVSAWWEKHDAKGTRNECSHR